MSPACHAIPLRHREPLTTRRSSARRSRRRRPKPALRETGHEGQTRSPGRARGPTGDRARPDARSGTGAARRRSRRPARRRAASTSGRRAEPRLALRASPRALGNTTSMVKRSCGQRHVADDEASALRARKPAPGAASDCCASPRGCRRHRPRLPAGAGGRGGASPRRRAARGLARSAGRSARSRRQVAIDEGRVDVSAAEGVVLEHRQQEIAVGGEPAGGELREPPVQRRRASVPIPGRGRSPWRAGGRSGR